MRAVDEKQVHSQLGTADLILAMEWLYEAIVWEVVLLLKSGEFWVFFTVSEWLINKARIENHNFKAGKDLYSNSVDEETNLPKKVKRFAQGL